MPTRPYRSPLRGALLCALFVAFIAAVILSREVPMSVLRNDAAAAQDAPSRRELALLEELEETLSRLLAQLERKGVDTAIQRVTLTLLQDFTESWIPMELAQKRLAQARFDCDCLSRSGAKAVAEARALLQSTRPPRRVPRSEMKGLAIRNGFFSKGGRPLLLFGTLVTGGDDCGEMRRRIDLGRLAGCGFNTLELWDSGAAIVRSLDTVDAPQTYLGDDIAELLDRAERANLAVLYQPAFHMFPTWPYDVDPELRRSGGKTLACIENPLAREVWKRMYDRTVPFTAGHPALLGYCVSNELGVSPDGPRWRLSPFCSCRYCAARFREFLRARYGTVRNLNGCWATAYAGFDAIAPPMDRGNPRSFYDWYVFRQGAILEFHLWARRMIERNDHSDRPMCAELFAGAGELPFMAFQVDWERFASCFEINAVATGMSHRYSRGDYAVAWQDFVMPLDLLRSLAPQKPLFDTEDHSFGQLISPGQAGASPQYISPDYVRAILWLGALHGRAGVITWAYARNYRKDQLCLLEHPEALEAFGRTALELQSLVEHVVPFARARADCAVLYSPASSFDERYEAAVRVVYEGLYFLDHPVRFVSESQLCRGELEGVRLLVIPFAVNVTSETFARIEEYVRRGGSVALVGEECLRCDEYGRMRSTVRFPGKVLSGEARLFGRGKIHIVKAGRAPREYFARFDALFDDAGVRRPLRLRSLQGGRPFGIEMRAVESGGAVLAYLVNLLRTPAAVTLDGAGAIRDVVRDAPAESRFDLRPLEVRVVEVRRRPILQRLRAPSSGRAGGTND